MPDHNHNHQHDRHHPIDDHDQLSSLDAQIAHLRFLIANAPQQSDWETAQTQMELGSLLRNRFSESQELRFLDEAVEVHRLSLSIFQDHPDHEYRPSFLSHYGFVLHDRFHRTHSDNDIIDAVSQHETALGLLKAGDGNEFDVLINLAKTLRCRFDARGGEKSHLDRAISCIHRAVALKPLHHLPFSILAGCLERRVKVAYDEDDNAQVKADVDKLLQVREKELKLASSVKSDPGELQNEIATSYFHLFLKTRLVHLLEKAISIFSTAKTLPRLSPRCKLMILINLSACLHARYQDLKNPADLKDAAELSRRCCETPDPLPINLRAFIIITLCSILRTQCDEFGDKSKLGEEILLIHQFLSSHEDAEVPNDDRMSLLIALGTALSARFLQSGRTNMKDLDDSLKFLQEARDIASTDADRMRATHHLVETLILRHHAQGPPGNPAVMRQTIQLQKEVVDSKSRGDPNMSSSLNTLASAWEEQFLTTRALEDLDESIKYEREAIEHTSLSTRKSTYLSNLVSSLHRRFQHTGRLEDLDQAITNCREAISYIEEPHPDLTIVHSSLGRLLTDKFIRTRDMECLQAATDAFRTAASNNVGSITQRFFTAQRWAGIADEHKHETAMEAYTLAVHFLPRLAVLGLDLSARRQMLTAGTDGLAREAATYAIRSRNFERAIEFLEEGRAVFWSQALQLRTSFDELEDSAAPGPELAGRLRGISKMLEQLSRGTEKREAGESLHGDQFVTEKHAAELQSLDEQWQACVGEVRLLPGFDRFLLPKSYSDLRAVSSHGPVVILNIARAQGEAAALILKAPSEKIVHVPLPKFKSDVIQRLGQFWGIVRGSAEYANRSRGGGASPTGPDLVLRPGLAALWATVVEPVIRALELKKSASPNRIWWCPTGLFASLPIHAAGRYGGPNEECLADYAVSSYIPTLTTLLSAVSKLAPQAPSLRMLAVIQPKTKDWPTLESTIEELENIQGVVPPNSLVSYGLEDAPAKVDTILREIPSANIVHFACHGKQDTKDPLQSALVLEDGFLQMPQIMELSLTKGSLVFLSACQTATGDQGLPDEILHLAATMLFSGFRGAVGTMWSIRDEDGPVVAESFYRHIFSPRPSSNGSEGTNPQTAEAARALHATVAKLRQQGRPLMSWVPFIHLGY